MQIAAKITEIKYIPFLCKKLHYYSIDNLETAFNESAFLLSIDEENKFAV
jgi:hypothetical protein